jgi:hypothetical protein
VLSKSDVAGKFYEVLEQDYASSIPSVLKGRGHALTIDHGWQEVAETALGFIRRFTD